MGAFDCHVIVFGFKRSDYFVVGDRNFFGGLYAISDCLHFFFGCKLKVGVFRILLGRYSIVYCIPGSILV